MSPLHRPGVPRRRDRPVTAMAAIAALPRRHALDLERRRRDELRHARVGEPAARVRPLQAGRRPDRRPARTRGRGAAHARWDASPPRGGRSVDHGRRARGRARGDHGRRGERGHRADQRGAPRGCQLRATRHPSLIGAARAPHRWIEPVGEGRRSASRRACRGPREPDARRPRRSANDGSRRCARRAAGAPRRSSASGARLEA